MRFRWVIWTVGVWLFGCDSSEPAKSSRERGRTATQIDALRTSTGSDRQDLDRERSDPNNKDLASDDDFYVEDDDPYSAFDDVGADDAPLKPSDGPSQTLRVASHVAKSAKYSKYFVRNVAYGAGFDALGEAKELVGLYGRAEDIPAGPGIIWLHGASTGLTRHNGQEIVMHLAAHGYRVLAVDLYAGIVPGDASEGQDLANRLRQSGLSEITRHLKQAKEHMQSKLGATRVALAGVGMGGELALEIGLTSGFQASAVVSFYGDLSSFEEKESEPYAPSMMFVLQDDPAVSASEIAELRSEHANRLPRVEIHSIPGVKDAFMEPALGAAFDRDLTSEVLGKAAEFIDRALLDPPAP